MRIWWSNLIFKFKVMPIWKKLFLSVSVVAFIVLIIAVYLRYFKAENPPESSVKPIETPSLLKESTLDGILVAAEIANRIPLAVMIENHIDARPQIGLDKASIIYEAIAEGGITRFMALYGPQDVAKAGPVRSARTYYVSWAQEYKALYAHVGGNMDALDIIKSLNTIYDLDQFSIGSPTYWRDKKNVATEHTMYTDTTKLRKVASDKGYPTDGQFTPNSFKKETDLENRPEGQLININFSTNTFAVKWTYDKISNSYLRSMAGASHKDGVSGEQLSAKNIIIQYVDRKATKTRINESGYIYTTTGEGKAIFITDGIATTCTWKRADESSRTLFYDESGNIMKYNPGVTWYEIVHPDLSVTIE